MVDFRILGPVEVWESGARREQPSPKARQILAMLLLEPGRVVPVDRLVDALWGEAPPPHARKALQVHISHLRQLLPTVPLRHHPPGYVLSVCADQVDLHQFRALAAQARHEPDPARAGALLRRALGLWRGPLLADVGTDWQRERYFAGLDEERLTALEARMQADLALARHPELAAELPALLAEHPLRERLHALLVTALHRCGRRAEALRAFHEARRTVVEELGVEPGEELRALHRSLLADPEPVTPRNFLPRDLPDFTGREPELTALQEAPAATDGVLPVWWLDGPTGVGKTALAVHAAHRLAARHPDGQLFVELSGRGSEEALDVLLRAVGVPSERIPDGLAERTALWRAELAGRRVLVVLDDADSPAQVRPLLAGGAGCLALVTSRQRLAGLEGVRRLPLDVLPPDRAHELFTRLLGADRVEAEAAAVAELTRLCGYLPLALRITGAKLAARPHWPVARLLARLRDERRRLDELAVGDLAVRTGLAVSYLGLPEAGRRAYRLLGALGYAHLPGWLAAPLLGVAEDTAEDLLEHLVDAQLVEVTSAPAEPPRYRMHDLVRLHARERAELEDAPERRREAVRRAVTALLATVDEFAQPLPPAVPRLCQTDLSGHPKARIGRRDRWFEQEEPALVAAVERAAELDLAELAAALAEALVFSWFAVRNRYDGWQRTHEAAMAALRRAGHRRGEAALACSLAQLHYKRDRYLAARGHFRTALALFAEVGDTRGEAVALNGIGMVDRELAEHRSALPALRRARRMLAASGDREGVAHALYGIGYAHRELGEDPAAISTLRAAARAYRECGNERGEALALRGIGLVHRAAGRWAQAEGYCRRSHRIVAQVRDSLLSCYTTQALAKVWLRQGQPERAERALRDCLADALALHDLFGLSLLHRTLGECHVALGAPAKALRYLDISLAGWTELGLPVWRARTLRDIGAAHAVGGAQGAAHQAWDEARAVFERLGVREAGEAPGWHRRWGCPCGTFAGTGEGVGLARLGGVPHQLTGVTVQRRNFLRVAVVGATAAAFGGAAWRDAFADGAQPGPSPYGPLKAADANGIALPEGFTSRVIARTGQQVPGTGYTWHPAPDGGACFADGSGWIYVSNSEVSSTGGVGAVKFDVTGKITGAYRTLANTNVNCAGGATPWQTWLSCEEVDRGYVYETDPWGQKAAIRRPAMGRFKHEACAADSDHGYVYLTEDVPDGCFYRFKPTTWGDLSTGTLEVLKGGSSQTSGPVTWAVVPEPGGSPTATRNQVAGAKRFNGGEGCYYADGTCWFTTKGDNRVWAYDARTSTISLTYDDNLVTSGTAPLTGVDNVTGTRNGDLFVAEDGGNMEICIITPTGVVAPFLRINGHSGSEICGPAFSPAGDRLYFSSQRGTSGSSNGGITYEVKGPFRH